MSMKHLGVPLLATGLTVFAGCMPDRYQETYSTQPGSGVNEPLSGAPIAGDDALIQEVSPENTVILRPSASVTALGSIYRGLVQKDAKLNLIFVPNADGPQAEEWEGFGDGEKLLIDHDPSFVEAIRQGVIEDTGGLYKPAEIKLRATKPFPFLGGCIVKDSYPESRAIDVYTRDFIDPDAVNVILVDAPTCLPNKIVAGYASADSPPIIVDRGFSKDNISDIITHELGHSMGLDHAGTEDCVDYATVKSCETSATNDSLSIMGYLDGQEFSAPELAWLGLLQPSEVITNPVDGIYTVGDAGQESTDETIRVMSIGTTKGVVSFSWQKDPAASYDRLCLPEDQVSAEDPNIEYYISKFNEVTGAVEQYRCLKVNYRFQDHSLQVRIAEKGDYSLQAHMLVLRPDRAPDGFKTELSNGEVVPGAVLFKDDTVVVTFIGTDSQNRALVQVEHI